MAFFSPFFFREIEEKKEIFASSSSSSSIDQRAMARVLIDSETTENGERERYQASLVYMSWSVVCVEDGSGKAWSSLAAIVKAEKSLIMEEGMCRKTSRLG
ncbi:hypothetical protein CsSME_00035255 [Camellia sinensis var. sinensis]